MKKVPSSLKIANKANQIASPSFPPNINSPKSAIQKKGYKNETKKLKIQKNIYANHLQKDQTKKYLPIEKKNQFKKSQQTHQIINQKSIKNSKSQRELAVLSQKLKKLQEKINKIREKQKIDNHQTNSHRSYSKNSENSCFSKKQIPTLKKQLSISKKYHIPKIQSHKALKKSYSDNKLGFQTPPNRSKYKKKRQLEQSRKKQKQQREQQKKKQYDEQILHQIVTQVPNSHPPGFKPAIENSLGNYLRTPSSQSEQQDEKVQLYYIGKAIKSLIRPAFFPVREHLIQSLQTLQFLNNIKKPSNKEIQKKMIKLPQSKCTSHTIIVQLSIVLDLDETLIHCNQSLNIPYDIKLPIKFPTGDKIQAGINIRPYVKNFLHELSKICQIIIFTASHQCYADVVLNYLDPKNKYISYRVFREHCWQTQEGVYIKDLRVFKNRSLDNMILVDNAAYSYYFQLENGVPIIPYYDDKNDKQLLILLQYIKQTISNAQKTKSTIRQLNQKYFKLLQYSKFQEIGPLVQELYSITDSSSHDN